MGNMLLKELVSLKEACDKMMEKDKEIFEGNEYMLKLTENSTRKAFYNVASDIIRRYQQEEEKEAADYENFLYGGKNNEI